MRSEVQASGDADVIKRSERLKDAVRRAGGSAAIVRKTDMPVATLNNYLGGRDMKVSALVMLADATNVSIEWLATGRGPSAASQPLQSDLFEADILDGKVHFWGLFVAIRMARNWFEESNLNPSLRDLLVWISSPYRASLKLPDLKIEFKSPDESQ